jgi:hypothetical protein
MKKTYFFLLIILLQFTAVIAAADVNDGVYLDPPYRHRFRPLVLEGRSVPILPARSSIELLAAKQSSVRAQEGRGTCSIFSATALMESLMILNGAPRTVDLSEEWLEYIVNYTATDDGSSSPSNIDGILRYGMSQELLMPYIGQEWVNLNFSRLAKERCGKVPARMRKSCLIVHRDPRLMQAKDVELTDPRSALYDPEFYKAKQDARSFKEKNLRLTSGLRVLRDTHEIKKSLLNGVPILLDIDFYYGAWNHRKAIELGLDRNMAHWDDGIVGYPEPDSLDAKVSRSHPAGHSVLVVGYDDNMEIRTTLQMQDGSLKDFTYKGVYFIKNSWGTSALGSRMQIHGRPYPGYAMITQKYAHEYGSFFGLAIR